MDISKEVGQVLCGKTLASMVKSKIKEEVEKMQLTHNNFKPGLAIVQVGNREDSNVYVGMKVKTGTELGFNAQHVKLPQDITEEEVLHRINNLNIDSSVNGIIVQLPLDSVNVIDASKCTNAVLPSKDVDGLHDINAGRLSRGDLLKSFQPCTPRGCMRLIHSTGINVEGKHAVVIGRSRIVGVPMASLLTWAHATVTLCHSRTKDLESIVKQADILVAACGQKHLVKGSWIKPGAVVIDCGINVEPDSTKKSGRRLLGDVEFDEAKKVASFITPVPGGVGPMTVSMLMENTLESAKRQILSNDEKIKKMVNGS